MREIKFRAWDIIEKRMMVLTDYSWMRQASDGKSLPINASVCAYYADGDNKGDHKRYYDRDNIILLEFTGLKDKKGVEIYEGDIIRYVDYIKYLKRFPKEECYSTGDLRVFGINWWVYNNGVRDSLNMLMLKTDIHRPNLLDSGIEVIGNIYQNI